MTQIKTVSDMYKNVEGHFVQTICCFSRSYKSEFQSGEDMKKCQLFWVPW